MTNMKVYFRSHMRANLRSMMYIAVIVTVLTAVIGVNAQPVEHYYFESEKSVYDYRSTLFIPTAFVCVLAYVLPVMEFSFFKKRINLDCAYSLPISRRGMGLVHYLTGLIMLFGAFTLSYLVNFALLLSHGHEYFNFVPMIGHYFVCLLLGFSIYSLMTFVFNEANTRGDGIWFMYLYTFVFTVVVFALAEVTNEWSILTFGEAFDALPWGTINDLTVGYQYLVELHPSNHILRPYFGFWFYVWVAIGILSAVGFFLRFGTRSTQKTSEISDSFFGYRVLIPLHAVCLMIATHSFDSVIVWILIELVALVGYTVYRRGFHYKKSDIAVLILLALFLFV